MKIILGSSSQGRRAVLERAGYTFEIMSPDIDEKAIRTDDVYELPLLVAREKARVLKEKVTEPALIIVGDQVVVSDGHLEEKPESDEEARKFLTRYSEGHPAETIAAVIVVNTETGKQAEGIDTTKVYFKPIPREVMDQYIFDKLPFSHAGGFAIEHKEIQPYIERLEGVADSTQGLPLALMEALIAQVK
jgi:septum formation protein